MPGGAIARTPLVIDGKNEMPWLKITVQDPPAKTNTPYGGGAAAGQSGATAATLSKNKKDENDYEPSGAIERPHGMRQSGQAKMKTLINTTGATTKP